VRLRFVFSSDQSTTNEGVGLDDIFIGVPLENDLIAVNLANTGDECGNTEDLLTIIVGNYGQTTQTDFQVSYQVNEGEAVTEEITDISLAPGEQISYTFNTPFNSSAVGNYDIRAWTDQEEEGLRLNDTTLFSFDNALELPFVEDFEDPNNLTRWTLDDFTTITRGHGNTSSVLFDNLWSQDPTLVAVTPSLGPITLGDSLSFEYRYVDYNTPNPGWELEEGDTLSVAISTDCGATFQTIHQIYDAIHTVTTEMTQVRLSLEDYAGMAIKVRFLAQGQISGDSDYYIDLDNIYLFQCRNLLLSQEVTPASSADATDGSVRVVPGEGVAPFTYDWSTGDITNTAAQLSPGNYFVTVTDRLGCASTLEVQIDVVSSADEPLWLQSISLSPNPTNGRVNLSVPNAPAMDMRIELLDMVGHVLQKRQIGQFQGNSLEMDLSSYPNGLYFVRIVADKHLKTVKVIKQ